MERDAVKTEDLETLLVSLVAHSDTKLTVEKLKIAHGKDAFNQLNIKHFQNEYTKM